jgi:hypothetical protein
VNPDTILEEQLELATSILRPERLGVDPQDQEAMLDEAERLARLVLALDEWHRAGGAPPARWVSEAVVPLVVRQK